MKATFHGLVPRFSLPMCCCMVALFSFLRPATGQDLSSPRFFKFNVQSLSSSTAPVIPVRSLGKFTPRELGPSFLYELALRFPIKMNGQTRLFGEIAHQNEYFSGIYSFEQDDARQVEALELFQTSASLIVLHQFNERWKLYNILNININSNQAFNFGRQALGYTNVTLFEKKIRKGTLGFGGLVSVNQNISVLPIFKYEARLNDKWSLDILLPSQALVYRNLSKRSRLLFGVRGDAATYYLTGQDGLEAPLVGANFRRISINGLVGIERQLTPLFGVRAEMGATLPYKCGVYDFDQTNLGLHDFQNRVSPHFRLGFFLSLPR